LKDKIINPLCRDIETDLRFHIHAHLKVSDRDPWKNGIKNLVSFVKLKPLRFFDENIDIKVQTTAYKSGDI